MSDDSTSLLPELPCAPTGPCAPEYQRVIQAGGSEYEAQAAYERCEAGDDSPQDDSCEDGYTLNENGDCVQDTQTGEGDEVIQQPISSFGKWRYVFNSHIHRPLGEGETTTSFYEGLSSMVSEYDGDDLSAHLSDLEPSHIKDKIRLRAGKYWSGHKWLEDEDPDGDPLYDTVFLTDNNKNYVALVDTGVVNSDDFQDFAKKTFDLSSPQDWHYDHAFKIATPFTKDDYNPNAPHHLYANINPNYNLYIPSYERISTSDDIGERFLPNFYALRTFIANPPTYAEIGDQMPWQRNHGILRQKLNISPLGDDISSLDGYFENYAYDYNSNPTLRQKIKRHDERVDSGYYKTDKYFKNLIVTHSNYNLLKSYNDKKHMFPMYFEIEFSTPTDTSFADLLKNSDISGSLMKTAIRDSSDRITNDPFYEYLTGFEESDASLKGSGSTRRSIDITSFFVNYSYNLNREDCIEELVANGEEAYDRCMETANDFDGVYLGKSDGDIEGDREVTFTEVIYAAAFRDNLQSIMDDPTKNRTFREIMEGKLAYSETVMYRIVKSEKKPSVDGEDTYEEIQSFYLPNSNDIDVHRYIDTQVKYGKEYKYTVYAWQLVFGSMYRYISHFEWTYDDNPTRQIEYELLPDIRLFETPYFTYDRVRMLDKPPIAPNIEVIPFLGVNNKVKINLSPNTGHHFSEPVILEQGEQVIAEDMLYSQGRTDGKLEYRSDDPVSMYEIYRIEHHPESYDDFFEKKLKDVGDPGFATSASTIEYLVPNKKYWYIFRSKDSHGHTSLPTPVYQVEIVDDDGAIYPLVSVVDFEEKVLVQNSKPLKRIMQILPAFPHTVPNNQNFEGMESILDQYPFGNDFTLGVDDPNLWGQTFKIRLTSKKTGKKIDLKVKFTRTHDTTNPNSS